MSTNPTEFIKAVDRDTTFPGSVRQLTHGIAEEMEARRADPKSIEDMASKLREDTERICDALISNLEAAGSEQASEIEPSAVPVPGIDIVFTDAKTSVDGFADAVDLIMQRAGLDHMEAARFIIREGVSHVLASRDGLPSAKDLDAVEAERGSDGALYKNPEGIDRETTTPQPTKKARIAQ